MSEKFRAIIYEGGHEREPSRQDILRLSNLTEKVFLEENKIGKGEFSFVYEDKDEPDYCFKVTTKKPEINVHEEAAFLRALCNLSDKVIVPAPTFSVVAKIERKNLLPLERSFFGMQRVAGSDFQKILDGKAKLPEAFNFEKFFGDLEEFFEEMHDEAGVYHCDFAAKNLMIEDKTGRPAVIDFGNAAYRSSFLEDEIRINPDIIYRGGTNDVKQLNAVKMQIENYLTNLKK